MSTTSSLGNTARLARWSLGVWMERQLQNHDVGLNPHVYPASLPYWRRGRTATELAAEIQEELSFALAQASWRLSSPSDQEVLEVAGLLLGYPFGPEVQILADAIIIAGAPEGSKQRQHAERRALTSGAGLIVDTYLR